MATLTVRNLDDDVTQALRIRAADHGRSMEAEVRKILRDALLGGVRPVGGATSQRMRELFAGLAEEPLVLPDRGPTTHR